MSKNENSASSSDEELWLLESPIVKLVSRKSVGVHPLNRNRDRFGEYHHLLPELKEHPKKIFQYMRMDISTFEYILKKVEPRLTKAWCNFHQQPVLPEERLVITIRYLATGSSFTTLSFTFRMGVSTVAKIVSETVVALWEELQPVHMPIPTKERSQEIAEEFYNAWNFPNCIGALDGKHVRILCPENSASMFFNYKKFFSVVLQAVTDARYKFIAIDVGGYGKQSDGGTFQASELYRMLENKSLGIPEPQCLPGTTVKAPFVFIADEAYPLLKFLLKPFGGRNLTMTQEMYNHRLSRARKTVECAFGILYSKWRLIGKCIETDICTADHIIKSVCVLHNTIIDLEGFDRHLRDVSEVQVDNPPGNNFGRPPNEAKTIRDIFATFFTQAPLMYK